MGGAPWQRRTRAAQAQIPIAQAWGVTEAAVVGRIDAAVAAVETSTAPDTPEPTSSEVRTWARAAGIAVPDRGRLRPEVWQAWHDAHTPEKEAPVRGSLAGSHDRTR
ncbi:MAG: Lsr2 family DNA-binding protein [Thermomicrobiales bacterium]